MVFGNQRYIQKRGRPGHLHAYKMIERKRQAFDLPISTVKEVVYSEPVRLIDVFRSVNGLQHWPDNDVWVDDSEIKGGFVVFEKLPSSPL
jgi:hypothetical protein